MRRFHLHSYRYAAVITIAHFFPFLKLFLTLLLPTVKMGKRGERIIDRNARVLNIN